MTIRKLKKASEFYRNERKINMYIRTETPLDKITDLHYYEC